MIKLIDKFLSKNKTIEPLFPDEPKILFGRYTDQNKTREQYASWDKAASLYKEKKYLDAYVEFFNYLKDSNIDNVQFNREESKITFKILQGSKVVNGTLNNREIQAEADVVRFEKLEVQVMRKLLQENYYLYFSKFAIKNDVYSLKYFSPIEDAHPSSLYYALKEVATEADMYDDVLVEEFDTLQPVNIEYIEQLTEHERQIKLKYFRKWVDVTLKRIKDIDSDKLTGSISYNLLNLAFKIYFLLAPEGKLLDDIRYIQGIFYEEGENNLNEKNYRMIEEFKIMQQKSDAESSKSFYKIKATFGVARPASHETVKRFMLDELEKTKWFIENKHPEIVREMCEYIVSYCCYTYGMPAIANEMLLIAWRVLNPEFFIELGFKQHFYEPEINKFHTDIIKKRINSLISYHKKAHEKIAFNCNNLKFDNLNNFIISFIQEFGNLNYDK